MASPQTKNGYTKIANEILDALCSIRIPGEARQCLDVVLRKTYGFQKKIDAIPLSQFCTVTGLKKPNVCRSLRKLINMNIIVVEKDNANTTKYLFNKDFETWTTLSKRITLSKKTTLSKRITNVIKKDNESLSKKIHSKENTKETTKETYPSGKGKADKRRPEITLMITALKKTLKLEAFADSCMERNIGLHLVNLYKKIGKAEFDRRLNYVLKDKFHRRNCNRIRYLYSELKSVPTGKIKPNII